jgi:DNA topoisomerase-1
LDDFKPTFDKELKTADEEMKVLEPEQVGRMCPQCGKPLIYRTSKRTGVQFIGCSGFPACKYVEFPNSPKRVVLEEKCPLCGKPLIERHNKRGEMFIGCTGFPKCRYLRKTGKDGKVVEFKNNEPRTSKYGRFGKKKTFAATKKTTSKAKKPTVKKTKR